jgi:hypothetical protein
VHGDQWHLRLGLTDKERDHAVADFYGGLFASYATQRGKSRWGDKTPFHAWHLERAIRLYPEATVVAILRHPAAVAVSMRRRFRRSIPSGVTHWMRNTRQLMYEADLLGERFVLVRYEDLVTDPESTMRALLERIGEPWADDVLHHHEVQGSGEAVGFTRTDRALDTASLGEWESLLKGPGRQQVADVAGPLAAFFGYDPGSSLPVRPVADSGVLLDGVEIKARKQTPLGAGIDWAQPRVLPKDKPFYPRKRRRPAKGTAAAAAEAPVRDTIVRKTRDRLSPDARKKLHELRRSRPWIDRLFGPK